MTLPPGTQRRDTQEFEEVKIPAPTIPPLLSDERFVPITEFDEWAQVVFKVRSFIFSMLPFDVSLIFDQGIETLNRIQSRVFDAAYKSNENLLICAPTGIFHIEFSSIFDWHYSDLFSGAGKTNIALMAMLHEIGQHFHNGRLNKGNICENQFNFEEGLNKQEFVHLLLIFLFGKYLDEFKIIYIAPMKALAAEMTANFSKRFQPLGISVKELTGDMQLTKKEISETQVIVTTPEKWDVITRKTTDVALTSVSFHILQKKEINSLVSKLSID
jgi:activating signal cointegrator complex subunit 3